MNHETSQMPNIEINIQQKVAFNIYIIRTFQERTIFKHWLAQSNKTHKKQLPHFQPQQKNLVIIKEHPGSVTTLQMLLTNQAANLFMHNRSQGIICTGGYKKLRGTPRSHDSK